MALRMVRSVRMAAMRATSLDLPTAHRCRLGPADPRISTCSGQGSHLQGCAHLGAAALTHCVVPGALSFELATDAVERGNAYEGGNLAAIQLTQLGQFGEEHTSQIWTYTFL